MVPVDPHSAQADPRTIEVELKSPRKSLHSEEHKKYKLGEDLDHLDVLSDEYETEYEAITARIDETYDRISELDEEIAGVDARIRAAYEKQIIGKNVYQFLLDFDTLYERMTDLEKKQFMRTFI